MLHRFICGDSLGEDSYGSTDPPEVVIRQVGQSVMQLWDIKKGQVMACVDSTYLFLSCFDPKKSFYLYEPGKSKTGPHFEGLEIPTMCSVSPDERRYHEFQKDGAEMLYMPTWTLPELQAVRKFVFDRSPEQMPLNEKDISKRFDEFGGIFRHVFARSTRNIERKQTRAIQNLVPKAFMDKEIDEERREVSHYVAQYRVDIEGDDAFREAHLDFASELIRKRVEVRFFKLGLNDKILLLQQSDRSLSFMSSMSRGIYDIYEDVIAKLLRQGVRWEKKKLPNSKFAKFTLKLTKMKRGELPKYAKMKEMVLYKPLNANYPAIDMMYRAKNGLVYGLQVTRQQEPTRTFETSTVNKWLKDISMENNMDKVRIAVIPRPDLAEEFKAKYDSDVSGYPQLEVWKVM